MYRSIIGYFIQVLFMYIILHTYIEMFFLKQDSSRRDDLRENKKSFFLY